MLPNIQTLDLSHNNISGMFSWNMGKDTLYLLNLSYNSISGFEMQPWKSMQILDLHSNLLQGPLPTPLNSLFFFSISHNKLSGEIAPLICKASSVSVLDLSSNNFGGMIPHCLGNFVKDLSDFVKPRENPIFSKMGKIVISVKIRNFSRSRITKRNFSLKSSREI